MGRTLHFSIKKEKSNFTRKELIKIYDVYQYYNSEVLLNEINETYKTKLKKLWSFDFFCCDEFRPNYKNPLFQGNNRSSDYAFDYIFNEIDEMQKHAVHYYEIIEALEKQGLIEDGIKKTNCLSSFCKVQGNEFNALLVFQALITISKKVPNAEIYLEDEGEFLLCPLKIKNGKALPLIEELVDDIKRYTWQMLFSDQYEGNILSKLTPTDFSEQFKGDSGIGNGYGDMTEYINNKLRNLKEVEKALIKAGIRDHYLFFSNIKQLEEKYWFNPKIFARTVVVEKFLNYKASEGTTMAGFSGVGFGLSDKDEEAESYRRHAQMFSFLEKLGAKKENIVISK